VIDPLSRLRLQQIAQVYVLARDYDNLPAGTLVMDCVLPPGALAHLTNVGYARLLSAIEWESTVAAGAQADRMLHIEDRDASTAAFLANGPKVESFPKEDLEEAAEAAKELLRTNKEYPAWVGRIHV